MVQEVKVQSSNYAAEYGSGGMSVSAVTKAGTSRFHGTLYDYIRDNETAANDRSNSIAGHRQAEEHVPVSRRQRRRSDRHSRARVHQEPQQAVLLRRVTRYQHQKVDSGARLDDGADGGDEARRLQRAARRARAEPEHAAHREHPRRLPGRRHAGARTTTSRPYIDPLGQFLINAYPDPNYIDAANNRYNYVYSALEPSNRNDFKTRIDYNISNNTKAYVRIARESETNDQPRGGVVGRRRRSRCRRPTWPTARGHSLLRQPRQRARARRRPSSRS